jgi:5-methyltetrahydropteroyltriglutamate--homocysteine methyltransferase
VVSEPGSGLKFQRGDHEIDFSPPRLRVIDRVRHVYPIQVPDFEFLAAASTRLPKITLPSPTMLHFRGGRGAISEDAYPDLEAFYEDVAIAYRVELAALARAGCRYVQLDDTNLAYLCDERMRESVRLRGENPVALVQRYVRLINAAIGDRPANLVVCMHLCRGNFRSGWFARGSYDPIAELLFNELSVDGLFLEYDDIRSGDFAPLRFVPPGKAVVLGLVTTKRAALEPKDELKRRIHDASRHVPLEQLCLSPQCGFSSTVHGNEISQESQAAKLRLVVETAREVWGEI